MLWALRVLSDAVRINKCASRVPGFDEQDLRTVPNNFTVVFIDDVIVYSKSREEHEQHLRTPLQLLCGNQLYAKLSECEFWLEQVVFLRHIISKEGLAVDLAKIKVVVNWERLKNFTEI